MFFPQKMVHIRGKKDVWVITTSGEKQHFTAVLTVTAAEPV